jgi:hypothetical protein
LHSLGHFIITLEEVAGKVTITLGSVCVVLAELFSVNTVINSVNIASSLYVFNEFGWLVSWLITFFLAEPCEGPSLIDSKVYLCGCFPDELSEVLSL